MSKKEKAHPLHRAWAAGILDAKVIFPQNGYIIRFDTTNEALLKRFYEIIGEVGTVADRMRRDINMKSPTWMWQTTAADQTREVLLLLTPFFSARRVKQSAELIGKIERSDIWRKNNPAKAAALVVAKAKTEDSSATDPA